MINVCAVPECDTLVANLGDQCASCESAKRSGKRMGVALADVVAERLRQIAEGDARAELAVVGELARAAACYAWPSDDERETSRAWPWDDVPVPGHVNGTPPAERRRQLVVAAALLIAEIEKMEAP